MYHNFDSKEGRLLGSVLLVCCTCAARAGWRMDARMASRGGASMATLRLVMRRRGASAGGRDTDPGH